jgi:hypothetical protein
VYLIRGTDLFEIDEVAEEIWDRCDGTRRAPSLIAELRQSLSQLAPVQLLEITVRSLSTMADSGLIELLPQASPSAPRPRGDSEARDEGDYLAAASLQLHSAVRPPRALSESPRKLMYYSVDTYFRESWEDILEQWPDPLASGLSRLASIVFKPEAVVGRRIEPALVYLRENGFRPVACVPFTYSRHTVREAWRYQFNIATRQRMAIVDLLETATESLFVMLLDDAADVASIGAPRLSALKGSSCEVPASHHLRTYLNMRSTLLNFVHTADDAADVVREIGVFFGPAERRELVAEAMRCKDRTDHVLMNAQRLYDAYAAHDLSFEHSIVRARSSCRMHASGEDDDGILAEIERRLAQLEAGRRADWQELFALFERLGGAVDRWDRIVVGAAVTEPNLLGLRPLV